MYFHKICLLCNTYYHTTKCKSIIQTFFVNSFNSHGGNLYKTHIIFNIRTVLMLIYSKY